MSYLLTVCGILSTAQVAYWSYQKMRAASESGSTARQFYYSMILNGSLLMFLSWIVSLFGHFQGINKVRIGLLSVGMLLVLIPAVMIKLDDIRLQQVKVPRRIPRN